MWQSLLGFISISHHTARAHFYSGNFIHFYSGNFRKVICKYLRRLCGGERVQLYIQTQKAIILMLRNRSGVQFQGLVPRITFILVTGNEMTGKMARFGISERRGMREMYVSYIVFSCLDRRNRMFSFADLNRIINQA